MGGRGGGDGIRRRRRRAGRMVGFGARRTFDCALCARFASSPRAFSSASAAHRASAAAARCSASLSRFCSSASSSAAGGGGRFAGGVDGGWAVGSRSAAPCSWRIFSSARCSRIARASATSAVSRSRASASAASRRTRSNSWPILCWWARQASSSPRSRAMHRSARSLASFSRRLISVASVLSRCSLELSAAQPGQLAPWPIGSGVLARLRNCAPSTGTTRRWWRSDSTFDMVCGRGSIPGLALCARPGGSRSSWCRRSPHCGSEFMAA